MVQYDPIMEGLIQYYHGDVAEAQAHYQYGPGNDMPQAGDTTSSDLNNLLSQYGGASSSTASPATSGGSSALGDVMNFLGTNAPDTTGTGDAMGTQGNPVTGEKLGNQPSWLPADFFPRSGIAVLAIIFVIIGLAALALKSEPHEVVIGAAKKLAS